MLGNDGKFDRRTFCKTTGSTIGGGLALSALSGSAAAATLHVDPSDSSSYNRISGAVNDAEEGDTITVAPGTYNEEVFVWTDNLTIVGNPGDPTAPGPGSNRPIIDGGGRDEAAGFRLTRTSGTTIAGFEIQNFGTNSWGVGIKGGASNIEIRDNYLHTMTGNGVGRSGWGQINPSNFTVARNVTEATEQVGIRLDNVSHSVVEENLIRGPGEKGIFIHTNVSNGNSVDNTGVIVSQNTVTGKFQSPIRVLSINRNSDQSTSASLTDVTIKENDLSAGQAFVAVWLLENSENGAPTELNGVSLEDNDIRNHDYGVAVSGGVDGSEVVVTRNNLVNNGTGLFYGNNSVLAAERNYWGAANGPNRPVSGQSEKRIGDGDKVIGDVDVTPWSPQEF